MSNVDRPRTDLKPCPFDKSTERDSNGQCHCRNVLYRLTSKMDKEGALYKEVVEKYNAVLKSRGKKNTVEDARAAAKALIPVPEKPEKAPAAKKAAPAKKAAAKKAAPAKRAPRKSVEAVVAEAEAEEVAARPEPEFTDEDLLGTAVEHSPVDSPEGGVVCVCGWSGKRTAASVKAHIAREAASA